MADAPVERFEKAITEAREEGNLSRANVALGAALHDLAGAAAALASSLKAARRRTRSAPARRDVAKTTLSRACEALRVDRRSVVSASVRVFHIGSST